MQLSETEELQDFGCLGVCAVDTSETDDKGDLGLSRNTQVARVLGLTLEADLVLTKIQQVRRKKHRERVKHGYAPWPCHDTP